jgi:photosystem II stability/assembly factor-like uncharacterized protein
MRYHGNAMPRWLGFGSCLLGAMLAAAPAWAHGRFPAAGQVAVDPGDPAEIWVRSTYGILISTDAGVNWAWMCPEAVGFNADREDPALVLTADGSAVVGTFAALTVSHDSCDFVPVAGELGERFFVDVQPEANPASVVALSSNGIGADTFEVNLWSSGDNAVTWEHLGASPAPDFLALTLGVALSDPNRLYLSGRDGVVGAYTASLQRSDDRGASWMRVELPDGTSTDGSVVSYLGAVDAQNADKLYVGVVSTDADGVVTRFVILASDDGGEAWQNVYERPHALSGMALSPDGASVAIGSDADGLWIAPASTLMFTKVSDLHIRCLTWVESGLYACADEFKDGFTLGRSDDGGMSFVPLMHLDSPCGPVDCPVETSAGRECPARWPSEQAELGAEDCATPTTSGSTGGTTVESCDCRLPNRDAQQSSRPLAWLAWMVGLGLLLARRKPG